MSSARVSVSEDLLPGPGRNILIAIDPFSDVSCSAALWALHELYRKGDVLHLVHVARVLSPVMTIQHGYQATYTIPDPTPRVDERAHCELVKQTIKDKVTCKMDELHAAHELHLFVDTDNAPASAVYETINKVAEEVDACILVMAPHNKAPQSDGWSEYLGSVADYTMQNTSRPLSIVRSYTPPFVMKMYRSHH